MTNRKLSPSDDKPQPDFSLEALRKQLKIDQSHIYRGPGAFTATEISPGKKGAPVYEVARSGVKDGTLVEVIVLRQDRIGRNYAVTAWVRKEVYDWWISQTEEPPKLG